MAKRKFPSRKNISAPSLITPRTEAESKIYGRIISGKKFLGLSIRDEKDLEAAKAQGKKWNDDNEALLKRLFDSESVFQAYNRSSLYDNERQLMNASWRQKISIFYESISTKITALESVIERLELIPEKVISSETQKKHEPEISASDPAGHDNKESVDSIVERLELIPEEEVISEIQERHEPVKANSVFIIHGRGEEAKVSVAEFIEKLGLKVVILHEKPEAGRMIIENLDREAEISGYAVVILTPDDIGTHSDDPNDARPGARQNVMFELGYFCGILGKERVSILVKEGLEIPIDYFGIACTAMDPEGAWQFSLAKDMKAAGLSFDANRIFY